MISVATTVAATVVTGRLTSAPMIERLRVTAASLPPEAQPALVVPDHRRRMVRAMVAAAGLGWPVLGIEEVDPQARVRLLGAVEA